VFISLFPPVAHKQPLEVAPTLDVHCTGCFWFHTLHKPPRAHSPATANLCTEATPPTPRPATPHLHRHIQSRECYRELLQPTTLLSHSNERRLYCLYTTSRSLTAQWPTPQPVPARPNSLQTANLALSPSPQSLRKWGFWRTVHQSSLRPRLRNHSTPMPRRGALDLVGPNSRRSCKWTRSIRPRPLMTVSHTVRLQTSHLSGYLLPSTPNDSAPRLFSAMPPSLHPHLPT
jgi:hypothetical protein